MPTSQKTQQIVASFQRNSAEEIGSYSIEDLEAALDDLEWRNEGIQRSINRRIDKLKTDSSKSYQSIVRAIVKWSTDSGHRVKAVNCQNEVNNDNRKTNETEVHRGI